MNLQLMKYKSFQWPHNPAKLFVSYQRDMKEFSIPFAGTVLQDYGNKKRIVTGEGEFCGSECMTVFQKLSEVFSERGSGLLSLPNLSPFMATFASLDLVGKPEPNLVAYRFTFWEDLSGAVAVGKSDRHRHHICKENESFWSIAALYHTTVEELTKLNPLIQWPNELKKGELIFLS